MIDAPHFPSGGDIPESDRPILVAGKSQQSVTRHRDPVHAAIISLELAHESHHFVNDRGIRGRIPFHGVRCHSARGREEGARRRRRNCGGHGRPAQQRLVPIPPRLRPATDLAESPLPCPGRQRREGLASPPKENLAEIEKALKDGGNSDVRAIEFRGLNHLFQPCKTCSPTEYAQIEMTIAPEVLKVIGDWIVEKVGSHQGRPSR